MKHLLLSCSSLAIILPFTSCSTKSREEKPMNIIYIMSDDHSYQTISAYDNRFIQTKNIDRIANEGVRFDNSFVANSISGPSRACMLTGKHSHINGFIDNSGSFDISQSIFPKLLQEAGYQTAIVGKWHLNCTPEGFDYWNILPGQGDYYNPVFIDNGERKNMEGYATDITTDLAIEWLNNNQSDPFCLLIHHKAPHRTWMPDIQDLGMFDSIDFPLPDNFFDTYKNRIAAGKQAMSIASDMDLIYDLKLADKENEIHTSSGLEVYGRNLYNETGKPGRMNENQKLAWNSYYDRVIAEYKELNLQGDELYRWKYQRYMKDYLSVIHSLDRNIGRLLDYLEETGLMDNTLIVYTSDQGFYMGEHGWYDKRFMYEESFRTPLVMRLPGGKQGVINQLVQNIDYAPTLLEIANVPIPEDIQGQSLLPLLKGEQPADWRKALYYHYHEYPGEHKVRKHYGIRTDRFKLIHFYDDIDEWELFDLQVDPSEMNNIYNDDNKELIDSLKKELRALQIYYNDPIAESFQ